MRFHICVTLNIAQERERANRCFLRLVTNRTNSTVVSKLRSSLAQEMSEMKRERK